MAKIYPDHRQNISRASSEYFQIDDDLISTDFLIAVNSPVSRCSKYEANPSEMWRVNIIFSATIVIFGFVTTILTITYKEDPPPHPLPESDSANQLLFRGCISGKKSFPCVVTSWLQRCGKISINVKDNIWMSFWLPKIVEASCCAVKTWRKKHPHDFSRWVRRVFWKLAPPTTTAGVKWVAVQMNDRRYLLALTL